MLDERLSLIQEETLPPGTDSSVLLNIGLGTKGFLQIEAVSGAQTEYKLAARAKSPFDPIFLTQYSDGFLTSARAGTTYEGAISGRQTLYLPIQLTETQSVKVELSGLQADVSMAVLGRGRRVQSSNHASSGAQAEFFSKVLEEGPYVVALRMQDETERSNFKVVYRTEDPPVVALTPEERKRAARKRAGDLGILSASETLRQEFLREDDLYYRFRIGNDGEQSIELNLWGFEASIDLDMTLENSSGSVLAKSANVGKKPEKIVHRLSSGTYYVRIQPTGSAKLSTLYFSASALRWMMEPDLKRFGVFVERHGDYLIYRDGSKCHAVTVAKSASPRSGWRKITPYLSVAVKPGEPGVWFQMDRASREDGSDVFQDGRVSARASVYYGGKVQWQDVSARFREGTIRPLVECNSKGGTCIDSDAIRSFRHGLELVIEGQTPDGEQAEIRYSLLGYTRAMQRINQICGTSFRLDLE